jgi:hypothetical protein
MHTAAEITQTFQSAMLSAEPAQIERLAEQLQHEQGDVERLISALAVNDVQPDLSVALRYQSALRRIANPTYFVRSLNREADDLDARIEKLMADASDDAGMAASRRRRGESALAEFFENRVSATERLAHELGEEALSKRTAAAQIEGRAQRRVEFSDFVRSIHDAPAPRAA